MKVVAKIAFISRVWDLLMLKPKFQCLIENASVRGMKVVVNHPIPEGVAVRVWVLLPDDAKQKALELRGRVCWSSSESEAGQFSAGISLDTRPTHAVAEWVKSIRQRVRADFGKIIPAESDTVALNLQGQSK